ncbi:MAG: response regulator transcription factor [Flavobacteriales bacterium]|nr:response regulator transcription factor [Flavobacteriales bacterium]
MEGITLRLFNNKIGEELQISVSTVDGPRTNTIKKLRVHHFAEVVRYAMPNGLT